MAFITNRRTLLIGALAASAVGALSACSKDDNKATNEDTSGPATLTLTVNAISGGKNAAEADWITKWVVPKFAEAQKAKGREVTVKFEAQGVDDENYKTKIALDLKSGKGADVFGIDGIWTGEFAEAGYIKPLDEVAKDSANWDGWAQISEAVQGALSYSGKRYGVPQGADGRVIYYNKTLFKQAGLPEEWAPTSWDEVLEAARKLKTISGVTPIQLNAGTAMGEATTMQGLLPMLVGTGEEIYADKKWKGSSAGMKQVMELYKKIYVDEKLGDPVLQQEAAGRDNSFKLFSQNKIGILLEGDYLWRSVINPAEGVGTAPMKDRDTAVGYTMIPAMAPGKGIRGQNFVSMSGGTGRVLNPNSTHPALAWELLAFMNSPEAYEARLAGTLSITPRKDVNAKVLSSDKMLTFVNDKVLPITAYRPGLAVYPEVSALLQQATLDVVTGKSADQALQTYVKGLEGIVDKADISS